VGCGMGKWRANEGISGTIAAASPPRLGRLRGIPRPLSKGKLRVGRIAGAERSSGG
jgi:hypothetical protein